MSPSLSPSVRASRTRHKNTLLASGTALMLASVLGCGASEPVVPETNSHEDLVRQAQSVIVGSRIQAESWNASLTTANAVFNEGGGDGQSVAGLQVNETIGYSQVDFGGGADQIQVRVGAPYAGGKADIYAGSTKIGTVSIDAATGSDWNVFATKTVSITKTSGRQDVRFKAVATGGDWLFKFDWFELHSGSGGGTTDPNPPTQPPQAGKVPVVVTNKCPFPLDVILSGVGDIPLEPVSGGVKPFRNLGTGASYTYYAPSNYPSARVSAYKTKPTPASPRELEKAEFTLGLDPGNGAQNIYYNLTYVDHVGLPMQINANGTGGGCVDVRCNKSQSALASAIASGCPDGLRYSMGGATICLAPRSFCLDGEYAGDSRRASVCNRLDGEIARCASKYPGQCNPGSAKTPQVYACSAPFFDQSAKWCSAITRGMVDAPDSTNVGQYYNTGKPFNLYAKWVHDQCGAVYSFAYDDYPMAANQAGFYTCNGGRQLNVTFCPAG